MFDFTINYRVSGQAHTSLMTNGIGELSACLFNIDLNDWSIKSYTLLFSLFIISSSTRLVLCQKNVHQVNCGKCEGVIYGINLINFIHWKLLLKAKLFNFIASNELNNTKLKSHVERVEMLLFQLFVIFRASRCY